MRTPVQDTFVLLLKLRAFVFSVTCSVNTDRGPNLVLTVFFLSSKCAAVAVSTTLPLCAFSLCWVVVFELDSPAASWRQGCLTEMRELTEQVPGGACGRTLRSGLLRGGAQMSKCADQQSAGSRGPHAEGGDNPHVFPYPPGLPSGHI